MVSDIHVDRVRFGYSATRVFGELTLQIPGGRTTAIMGANGSGKSTLLGLIARTLRPERGTVELHGDVALAVQHSGVGEIPITVAEAVTMGRWRHLGLLRRPSHADREIVEYWITQMGLGELRRRRLADLSGGQRQRTLLAQAFAQESPTVLLDEPTVGLDTEAADRVARQVHRLAASGTTIVAATHDVDFARRFDFCVLLGGGEVLATGTPSIVLSESNLASAMTLG
jgi:zinc/manganese transport system ATP-binding protein